MKSIFSKTICTILVAVLAISSFTVRANESTVVYNDSIAAEFGREFAYNYAQALDIIAVFYESLPTNRAGRTLYPDNFGGLYINENGELVVLLVEDYQGIAASVATYTFTDANANIRTVDFSYNELREAFDFLDYFIPNAGDNLAAANVNGITFDVKSNLLLVSLVIYNDHKVSMFTEMVIDAPFIVFHESPGIPTQHSAPEYMVAHEGIEDAIMPLSSPTVRPGDGIYLRNAHGTLISSGSFGYRAVVDFGRGEQMGFVTAAHLGPNAFGRFFQVGDRIYNRDGQHVGTVQLTRLDSIDAAFVSLAAGVTGSNITVRGAVLGRIENTPIGGPVILDGRYGRGRTGTIIANWSGNTAAGWVSGARASYTRHNGDSGGIVYTWVNASNNGVVGIHVEGWGIGTWADGGNAIFTRANSHRTFLGNQLSPR